MGNIELDLTDIQEEFGAAEAHARTILALLRNLGAGYMEAEYSGGGDEGGVEQITLYRKRSAVLYPPGVDRIALELEPSHPLWRAVDAFLATEYWSWAGDFSASGTLYALLAKKRVWVDGLDCIYTERPRLLSVKLD
jgi:hypothetical protein